ncbi:MucR family transcriptional regulator [Cognatishimia activa]|uniref:Transcriptional regulatory protein ros n=1 Tax=Cognatishimia activa TaxID=1715691 RepID=A0A0N7MBN4_9RHOB|nr:MucR family transcriptional regulator [Cognatishimia activa]CUI95575.1 Transcriptional regulatory protein ros [Cognatishimia activa]CUK25896.1 Transcriptional regulatory protein ros [Cognatishimia activa]
MAANKNMDDSKNQNKDAVATIVASYAQRSDVTPDQIVALAAKLLPVFSVPGQENADPATGAHAVAPDAEATKPKTMVPAIPIDQAVTDDKVYCLICGKGFTMLKRHLKAEHGLTEDEYRKMFGLPDDFPLVAPNYSKRKAAYAKKAGLGKYRRDTSAKEGLDAR